MVYLPSISPTGGWQALGGDDYVIGGDAANTVDGGAGADLLMGGVGTDEITGRAGNDWMWGGDMTGAGGDIIYLHGAGDVAIAESSIDAADFIFA